MGRYEQPEYSVVAHADAYEIREYESYLAAETTVSGDFGSSGNAAFRRLAGFIFGRNSDGRKMKMTVPVFREFAGNGGNRYRFVMESAYTPDTLPRPIDDDVRIVTVPAGLFAVRSYRGGRQESLFRRAESELTDALQRDSIRSIGPAFSATYDGPLVPPFVRRNEVLVPIAPQG